jgi:hypothetical protein
MMDDWAMQHGWKQGSFLTLDTETTGVGDDARVVSVGLVEFYKGRPIEQWGCICNPGPGVDWDNADVAEALAINGMSPQDLLLAPPLRYFMPKIAAYCDSVPVWAGHNVQFDLDLLNIGCHIRRPPAAIIDTILVDAVCAPDPGLSRSLRNVAIRCNVERVREHQAVGDCLTVGWILGRYWDNLPGYLEGTRGLHDMLLAGARIRTEQLQDRGKNVEVQPPYVKDYAWGEAKPMGRWHHLSVAQSQGRIERDKAGDDRS